MKTIKRPWGDFKQFILNKKCTVKILEVNPNQKLSLQMHKKRTENWYFLTSGTVQIKNKKIKIKKGQLIQINPNTPHRIIADKNKVEVLEISLGIFNEKDEIRLEDKYGRK
ncbi:MAG: cupin domain-containing protein [Candidatus Pacearchaeota archaeon]